MCASWFCTLGPAASCSKLRKASPGRVVAECRNECSKKCVIDNHEVEIVRPTLLLDIHGPRSQKLPWEADGDVPDWNDVLLGRSDWNDVLLGRSVDGLCAARHGGALHVDMRSPRAVAGLSPGFSRSMRPGCSRRLPRGALGLEGDAGLVG
eukprot:TRINITY_DN38246_c0_g1_i1.p1 TRINITY_DN38246_c0_g1~~TRINITY_DN38246_c0_g1_i1.p1  ORF type:complete len:151 (+),score=20.76 TRINITY_DN38246_c0_g1_i1:90-542(+)